jgi:hypothetical protein
MLVHMAATDVDGPQQALAIEGVAPAGLQSHVQGTGMRIA